MADNNYTRMLDELYLDEKANKFKIERLFHLKDLVVKWQKKLREDYQKTIEYNIYSHIEIHCKEKPDDFDNLVTDHTLGVLIERNLLSLEQAIYASIAGLFSPSSSISNAKFDINVVEISSAYTNYLRYAKARRKRNIIHKEMDFESDMLALAHLFIEIFCPDKLPSQDLFSELTRTGDTRTSLSARQR